MSGVCIYVCVCDENKTKKNILFSSSVSLHMVGNKRAMSPESLTSVNRP